MSPWRPVLFAAAVVAVLLLSVPMSPWVGFAVGVIVGFALAEAGWRLWRRRHPPVTPAVVFELRRRAAPWN
jgi:membrane protein implicated in regulation of membrane protease activity